LGLLGLSPIVKGQKQEMGPAKTKPDLQESGAVEDLSRSASENKVRRRKRWRRALLFTAILIIAALAIGRALMPWAVRNYVNRTLDRALLYSGSIGPVEIHLLRGAYSIENVQLNKTTGNIPVPLFSAKRLDLAIQWNALLHGRIVGQLVAHEPEINFVDAGSDEESQTGGGGPWLQMISDLFPFSINSAIVQDGSVHFRTYKSEKPVDVYLSDLNLTVSNLSNINKDTTPLAATVQATATAMDQAKLDFKMSLDPLSYRPTFHFVLRLLGLDVTKINDLALAYGKFDFKRGWFDLVLETDCKEGLMTGYAKPLFRNLKVFSLVQDIKEDDPGQFFMQALVGATTRILTNQHRDQFGTLVPFTGDATGTTTVQILATIGHVFRNAFIRAYLPRLENTQQTADDLHFGAADFTTAISSTDNEDQ
jgi:hypothetical protein